MKQAKDKMVKLVGEMSHFDPDNMQMGAKALTELIVSGQLNLDEDEEAANSVRDAFMKQMESQNYNVHAHAIKCVADVVPRLPGGQVELIFQRILKFITDLTLEENKRERYGVCAGTVIHQAAKQFGQKLCGLFVESIKRLLELKDQKTQIEIILITIISEFVKKWPSIASNPPKLTYDRKGLVIYLLKNVETKSKMQIIKKSEYCLGKLALIAGKDVLDVLLNDKSYGLIPFILAHSGKNRLQNLKGLRNGLLCLSQILRTHNSELRHWARCIASQVLIPIVHFMKGNQQIDQIDLTCDILDASLISLSSCLKSYSRELKDLLDKPVNPFNDFVEELVNFNVEGMMAYAGEPIEVEYDENEGGDDYYEEAEADEKCWKVRRAAIHYISFLIRKDKHFRQNVSKGASFIEILGSKLVEENSMVSQMAFFTFNNLIQSISVERNAVSNTQDADELPLQRVKSSENDLALKIISEINAKIRIVFSNAKFNDQLKIEASKIILRLVQFYRDQLAQGHMGALVLSLISNILEEARKSTVIESKNNLVLCLRELIFDSVEFAQYNNVINAFLDLTIHANIKIQASAFRGFRTILRKFPRQLGKSDQFPKILQAIKRKLKEHDSDKIVKVSVLRCVGPIFEHFTTQLQVKDISDILQSVAAKLKIEIEKTYILEQLSQLSESYKPDKSLIKSFEQLLQQTSQSLGSSNYELNTRAIQATNRLILLLDSGLSGKVAQQVLAKSKILFNQGKIPAYVGRLIQLFPVLLKPYVQLLVKSTESVYIVQLIKAGILDVKGCLGLLQTIDKPQKMRKISLILGSIGTNQEALRKSVDQSVWGKTCLGAIGYIGNPDSAQFLLQIINEGKNEELRFEAASALGNIASRFQDKLVPLILGYADKSKEDYIYIFALREMLVLGSGPWKDLASLAEWLFKKGENKYEGQSNYYIISECIGRIAYIAEQAAHKILVNTQSPNQNRRFIVANALRFGLQNKVEVESEHMELFVGEVMKLIGDSKVSVRQGATRSLGAIANIHFKMIKVHRNQTFWKTLRANLLIDKSQIVIIDYGISKEKKDLARPLRLESFSVLQSLIRRIGIDGSIVEEFIAACLDQLPEQSSTDIVLKRLHVLKSLCESDYSAFIRFQDDFIKRVGLKEGLLKPYLSLKDKKQIQDERTEIFLKGLLREIIQINIIAEKENIEQIGALLAQARSIPLLSALIQGLQASK